MNTLNTSLDTLQTVREVDQRQWIPVKNSLPPYGESVMVFLDFHNIVTIAARTHTDAQGEHWSCEHMKYITHWMLLPIPPIRKV